MKSKLWIALAAAAIASTACMGMDGHRDMHRDDMDRGSMSGDSMNRGSMSSGSMDHGSMNSGNMGYGSTSSGTMSHGSMSSGNMNSPWPRSVNESGETTGRP